MKLKIHEINARSILSKSGIPGHKYCINPYTGCSYACKYCYATFMQRFTGHTEPWGSFVDIKINAPELLRKQLKRAERGAIIMSSVTDPYQSLEGKYRITRKCIEVISLFKIPLNILTKSPLVTRDIDIIAVLNDAKVGITITTDNDRIRKIFEPAAPSISARINTLKKLHDAGISTYVFIGPLLPMNPESLTEQISPFTENIIIDRMNYTGKTRSLYKKHKIEKWLDPGFTGTIISRLRKGLSSKDLSVC